MIHQFKIFGIGLFLATAIGASGADFALHNGARVVFYGDSITDNSPYTSFVELYTVTRFPNLDVRFFNAGVGGDRVTGGWMGGVDVRLPRDLFSRRPTVITSMLGMNDGSYRPLDQAIFDTYRNGYKHIADEIKKSAPSARVYLIQPSPFDDVTREPSFPGGYNGVLTQYGNYVVDLAKTEGFNVIDLNTPVVAMLQSAKGTDAAAAAKIIPDRVHPGAAGHLVMAEAILKAWGATPLVSNVEIDFKTGASKSDNAAISGVKTGTTLTWTSKENSLPFPMDRNNGEVKLVLASSDFDNAINQETLKVTNLPEGNFKLAIDGKDIGQFSSADLSSGVNLAKWNTPMMQQANRVAQLTSDRTATRYFLWRQLEFGLASMPAKDVDPSIHAYERAEDELIRLQHKAARPTPHVFAITQA